MTPPIDLDQIRFNTLLTEFQAVIRQVSVTGRTTKENDAEHSFALAMMALYLNHSYSLGLDDMLLMRNALVHDIPEVYAGDAHVLDHKARRGKDERETLALQRIVRGFPEFEILYRWVWYYHQRRREEDELIYALDKVMPMLMIYQSGGGTWQELDFSLTALMANKSDKTKGHKFISSLSTLLEGKIRETPHLFPRP